MNQSPGCFLAGWFLRLSGVLSFLPVSVRRPSLLESGEERLWDRILQKTTPTEQNLDSRRNSSHSGSRAETRYNADFKEFEGEWIVTLEALGE